MEQEGSIGDVLRELQASGFQTVPPTHPPGLEGALPLATQDDTKDETAEHTDSEGTSQWKQLNQALLQAGFPPLPLLSADDLPHPAGLTASPDAVRDVLRQVRAHIAGLLLMSAA